jgi:acyl-CoA thioester hydrolase
MSTHHTDIRVRYQETDNMGVVYYANYFVWFEVGRAEHMRALGLAYSELEKKGVFMMVASASCQYKSPARYDDVVRIETRIPEIRNSSLKFEYRLSVGAQLIATGESVHVMTNEKGRPVRVSPHIKGLLSHHQPK